MLFAVKNHFLPALALLAIFVAASIFGHQALGLDWRLELRLELLSDLLAGAGVLALNNALLHGLLVLTLGTSYRNGYRALVEYFRPQGMREIITAGLLAGGEELVFRGLLLEALISSAEMSAAVAVAATAVVFALLHALPRRALLPFTLWAFWEGALLGWVYLISGSLLVCLTLHVLHDIAGFALFAYQRRTGWLL